MNKLWRTPALGSSKGPEVLGIWVEGGGARKEWQLEAYGIQVVSTELTNPRNSSPTSYYFGITDIVIEANLNKLNLLCLGLEC